MSSSSSSPSPPSAIGDDSIDTELAAFVEQFAATGTAQLAAAGARLDAHVDFAGLEDALLRLLVPAPLLAGKDIDVAVIGDGMTQAQARDLLRSRGGESGPDFVLICRPNDLVDKVLALELGAADVIESPLVVRPYLAALPPSRLFTLMTVGMAGVAGTILAAYAGLLGPAYLPFLLAAAFMSAPGGLLIVCDSEPANEHPLAMTVSEQQAALASAGFVGIDVVTKIDRLYVVCASRTR